MPPLPHACARHARLRITNIPTELQPVSPPSQGEDLGLRPARPPTKPQALPIRGPGPATAPGPEPQSSFLSPLRPAGSRSREPAAADISQSAPSSSSSHRSLRPACTASKRAPPHEPPPPIEGWSAPWPHPYTERSPPLQPSLLQSSPPFPRRIPAFAFSGALRPGA